MTAAARLPLAVLLLAPCLRSDGPRKAAAPTYTAESIVNAADYRSGNNAPFSLITVFGRDLAYSTGVASSGSLTLPTLLAGVSLRVGATTAFLLFVSPTQINALIPYEALPGTASLTVRREGVAGPTVEVRLEPAAPGLFLLAEDIALATHADGALLSPESPARPGEWIVAYLTGLGPVQRRQTNQLVAAAIEITRRSELEVRIGGELLPPDSIYYAGLTPGTVGVYQVNLKMPESIGENPLIEISLGGAKTKEGLRVWAAP